MQTGGPERGYNVLRAGVSCPTILHCPWRVKAHGRSRTSLRTGGLYCVFPGLGSWGRVRMVTEEERPRRLHLVGTRSRLSSAAPRRTSSCIPHSSSIVTHASMGKAISRPLIVRCSSRGFPKEGFSTQASGVWGLQVEQERGQHRSPPREPSFPPVTLLLLSVPGTWSSGRGSIVQQCPWKHCPTAASPFLQFRGMTGRNWGRRWKPACCEQSCWASCYTHAPPHTPMHTRLIPTGAACV